MDMDHLQVRESWNQWSIIDVQPGTSGGQIESIIGVQLDQESPTQQIDDLPN